MAPRCPQDGPQIDMNLKRPNLPKTLKKQMKINDLKVVRDSILHQIGAKLAQVGPKLAQVGPSWPQVGPKLAQVGPSAEQR